MPKFLFLPLVSLFLIASTGFLSAQEFLLQVIYPRENLTIVARDSTFIFGHYAPAGASILVNGIKAHQYANNTFWAFVPVTPGHFNFHTVAYIRPETSTGKNFVADSLIVNRGIYIPNYLAVSPQEPMTFDTSYVFPQRDLTMKPGGILGIAIKGTPKRRVLLSIDGLVQNIPLIEKPARKRFYWRKGTFNKTRPHHTFGVKGIYSSTYAIPESIKIKNAVIHFKMMNTAGDSVIVKAPGSLNVLAGDRNRYIRLKDDVVVSRTRPGTGYQIFLHQGVVVETTGRDGTYIQAQLMDGKSVWLSEADCEFSENTVSSVAGTIGEVKMVNFSDKFRVSISLDKRLPYKVKQRQKPSRIEITFIGISGNAGKVQYHTEKPNAARVNWSRIDEHRHRLNIHSKQSQLWGYYAFYEENQLFVDIKKKPFIKPLPYSSLHDMLVCLDPGHGPDFGAIGATGLTERDANFKLAQIVKSKLLAKGAYVTLTRSQKEHNITLSARRKYADISNADIFISLHYNALPDGVNPFVMYGSSAYYFHSQNYTLANTLLLKLINKIKLSNFGLFRKNLAMCRITSMPAVLIEPAFMTQPTEEALILDSEFQQKTANAIIEGLESFFDKYRK